MSDSDIRLREAAAAYLLKVFADPQTATDTRFANIAPLHVVQAAVAVVLAPKQR